MLAQQMSAAADSDKGVRTGDVGRIVAQQKSEISTAAAKYNAEVAETRCVVGERIRVAFSLRRWCGAGG